MRDAFWKAFMPGLEYMSRSKPILRVVAHEHAGSMSDHWDGRFEEEEEKLPDREAEEEDQ